MSVTLISSTLSTVTLIVVELLLVAYRDDAWGRRRGSSGGCRGSRGPGSSKGWFQTGQATCIGVCRSMRRGTGRHLSRQGDLDISAPVLESVDR